MTTVKACPLILVIALLLFSCEQREPSAPLKPTETSNSSPMTITVAEPKDNPSEKNVDEPPIASPSVTTEQSADSRPNAVPDWIEPDEREQLYLDYTVTDQHGNEMKLADLIGKPWAVSFIFTRCPRPDMCPLIVNTMARLQSMAAGAGIGQEIELLLISYDPSYDTPERLKRYGDMRGLDFSNAKMLRPSAEDTPDLLAELDIGIAPNADATIDHFVELVLVDHEGRLVRKTAAGIWDNDKALEQLKRLVAHQRQPKRTSENEKQEVEG